MTASDPNPVTARTKPVPAPLFPMRPMLKGRKLMILLNGGRQSRNWLLGIVAGCRTIGVQTSIMELDVLWKAVCANKAETRRQMEAIIVKEKIGAFLGYALNGVAEMPQADQQLGVWRSFLELHGIPHLLVWADHPQWAVAKQGLSPQMQMGYRSGSAHHFVKSEAHAEELRRILGWPNCHELPLSADVEVLRPSRENKPEFDVVAIFGNDLTPSDWMKPFLEQEDPNPREIAAVVAEDVGRQLEALWQSDAPPDMHDQLLSLGKRLTARKAADPDSALIRFIPAAAEESPAAVWWLTANYPVYFKMASILYAFRSWQRVFYPAYLAKYFKVAIFGATGAAPGITTSPWVDFKDLPTQFARGKVALNVVSGWDEEGLTAKTFEIVACGVPLVHNECRGLSEIFEPGREVLTFQSPKQCRETIQALLDDEPRREQLAHAALWRMMSDHTWGQRIKQMFLQARLPIESFMNA